MSFEAIRLAVETHMMSWSDAPIAIDGSLTPPDVQAAQDDKQPWVRLTINHGDSFTAGLGSEPHVRRTGLVMVQIFTPENKGSRPAALLADSLAEHLQYHRDGPLETLAASVQRVGPSQGTYQYNVSVPFRYG